MWVGKKCVKICWKKIRSNCIFFLPWLTGVTILELHKEFKIKKIKMKKDGWPKRKIWPTNFWHVINYHYQKWFPLILRLKNRWEKFCKNYGETTWWNTFNLSKLTGIAGYFWFISFFFCVCCSLDKRKFNNNSKAEKMFDKTWLV